MTQQILYATATGEIIQWQDTAAFSYAAAPSGTATLDVTPAQWAEQAGAYYVSKGALVAGTIAPPAPTLAQQAATAMNAGFTITLSGTITLAATLFPCDTATQAKLGAVVTTVIATQKFPGGATSYPMRDSSGAWHTFTEAQYTAVAGAISAYVSALDLIIDGNPLSATALPSASAALSV